MATKSLVPATIERDPAEFLVELETKARNDYLWCAPNLLRIKPKNEPLLRLNLKWTQRRLAERYMIPAFQKKQAIGLALIKPRRIGSSTFFSSWAYHKVRFFPGFTALASAHRDDTVEELHQMSVRFHNNLPKEMQPRTERNNRKELRYPNPLDSSIRVVPAAFSDIAKGKGIHFYWASEVSQYPDMELIMQGINEAVPDHGSTAIVLETTSNYIGDWWHEFWKTLGRKREVFPDRRQWYRVFFPWYADPENVAELPHGWEMTAEERDMQVRFKLRAEQVAWYRFKLGEQETLYKGRGRRIMRNQYPATPDESFMTAGQGIFTDDILDRLAAQQRNPSWAFELIKTDWLRYALRPCPISRGQLYIWEMPRADCQYAIGADVSEGIGKDGSAIVVLRMPGFVQVAEWYDEWTKTGDLAGIIAAIARFYAQFGNRPIVNVEVTGPGISTNARLSDLYDHDPFDLYVWEPFDRLAPPLVGPASLTGWKQTYVSKHILVTTALNILSDGYCEVPSADLQADMQQVTEERFQSYATTGCDLTVAWLLAVVAAWRKIARFEFMAMAQPEPKVSEAAEMPPPWMCDTTWAARVLEDDLVADRWGSDTVDWRFQ